MWATAYYSKFKRPQCPALQPILATALGPEIVLTQNNVRDNAWPDIENSVMCDFVKSVKFVKKMFIYSIVVGEISDWRS